MGMQPPEMHDFFPNLVFATTKNDRVLKWHTLSNGKKIQCAGYEGFAYDELLRNYEEDEIKIDELQVPIIEYKNRKGLNKFWSPDIFLPKENKIVETLPIWTHARNPDRSYLRSNASILEGYKYELWLYDFKGNRISKKQPSLLASAFDSEALEPSLTPDPATLKQDQ
jgi:hypothetical protein